MRSDDVSERVRALVAPPLEAAGLELFDTELVGSGANAVLRVTVDRPGGVDLDAISDATTVVSRVLDADPDVVPGRYLLEVSSPGIERPLRRPEHFRRAVGSAVTVKVRPETAADAADAAGSGDRRVDGVLEAADDDGITVAGRVIPYPDIEKARTRFVWPEAKGKAGARR